MRCDRAFALALALALAASGAGAGAGPAGAEVGRAEEIVELRYAAPPGCPTRDAAVELIRERTPAVRFAAGAPRVFEVVVTAGEHGYTGALVVDDVADKQLTAPRCDDLVTALALVIALAIDPAAAAAPRVEAVAPPPPPLPRTPPPARRLDAALAGVLGVGPTPDLFLAGGVAARAAWPAVAAELAVVAGRDSIREDGARATFTRFVARPAACRLRGGSRLEVGGCGHAEVGLVRATGEDIINSRGLNRLWVAVGAHGTLRWPAMPSRGFAQLQLGLTVPITRDRYRFLPGILIHETPPLTGWLSAGVGLRFP
jgi:hypothetical protein